MRSASPGWRSSARKPLAFQAVFLLFRKINKNHNPLTYPSRLSMKISNSFKRTGKMALKDSFNKRSYEFHKMNDSTLRVRHPNDSVSYRFDFAMRLLTVQYGEALSVQAFDRLDREMLIELRDKLVEMGGKPPELPAEQPPSTQPRKFTP